MASLYSPSHLKQLCKTYQLKPSKKYGQNYLIADGPIQKIVAAADVGKQDTVVEVGPGFGVLTLALAPQVKRIIAFEIEKKLQPYWKEQQAAHPNIDVIWGNVLKAFGVHTHRASLFGDSSAFSGSEYTVVANLPYQITSNAIRTFLEAAHKPKRIVVMVQKEVAQRICAKPGDMSLLSVSVQYYGKPRIVTTVSKGNFWPQPKVDSAVVAIDEIRETSYSAMFFPVVRAGFANKRKQLWRNLSEGLKKDAGEIKQALHDSGVDHKIRAQAMTIAQWESLVKKISTV